MKRFEMLTASGFDGMATRPGAKSFTTALIESMKELCIEDNKSFSTFRLNQRLKEKMRHRRNPPELWNRLKVGDDRHIRIAPVIPRERHDGPVNKPHTPGAVNLILSFELSEKVDLLDTHRIEKLTSNLNRAFVNSGIGIRCIDFKGLRPRRAFREAVSNVLRLQHAARRLSTQFLSPVENGDNTSRKRKESSLDTERDESDAKRQQVTMPNGDTGSGERHLSGVDGLNGNDTSHG